MKLLEKFLTDELEFDDIEEFIEQFKRYETLLLDWNKKINLVSRSTISIEDHILNSIFFLKKFKLNTEESLADIGTGGGFPGIPLKILFPQLKITLIDSINKKVTAVNDIVQNLHLQNTTVVNGRAEVLSRSNTFKQKFDYVTAKAVAPLEDLYLWSSGLLKKSGKMLFTKGGDISGQLKNLEKEKRRKNFIMEVIEYSFPEEYKIEGKKLVVVSMFHTESQMAQS